MRILTFTPYFPPHLGGLETLVGELTADLVRRGHEVAVFTSSEPLGLPEHDEWHGAAVRRFPLHSPLYRNEVRRLAEVRSAFGAAREAFAPDLTHVHLADGAVMYHVLTQARHPSPTVLTVHSAIAASEARPGTVLHQALLGADAVTACSQAMLEAVVAVAPAVAPRARVVLNGIDTTRIDATPLPAGDPGGDAVVLLAGRHVPEKGLDVGLRAVALLADREPGLRVLLVGDGPAHDALLALAAELGIADRVEATGAVAGSEMSALYARATVVAVPSRYAEPFGIVAVEAGLAGRPVVASAAGGLPEIVVDGVNGLLVPQDDPTALAGALGTLLADRALAARLGAAGRERAVGEFSMTRHTDAITAVYDEVVEASRGG
ncbi:MAG: glycosyltransferase family 4 protein [Acidimicrobiia bacterium]